MIQYRKPVRRNSPVQFQYTFLDQDGVIIPLSGYTGGVFVEYKLEGQVFDTFSGSFVGDPSLGVVQAPPYRFATVGIWTAQFHARDTLNNRLYGEPIRFRVAPNVDDLALSELPNY